MSAFIAMSAPRTHQKKGVFMRSEDQQYWGLYGVLGALCFGGFFFAERILGFVPTVKLTDILLVLGGLFVGLAVNELKK
jgi:hypothetical protein